MNEVYVVSEHWDLDSEQDINMSYAYTSLDAAKAHLAQLIKEEEGEEGAVGANPDEVWEFRQDDLSWIASCGLGWIDFNIHVLQVKDDYTKGESNENS